MEGVPKDKKEDSFEKPKYTLEDLEKERLWDSGFGPNNPGAERREWLNHQRRLREIEEYLKKQGVIEYTEEEKTTTELDKIHPKAKSKQVVEHNGKKYKLQFYPLETSGSGKTVREWGHRWKLLD